MFIFRADSGFAVVATIGDRTYTVQEFLSEADFKTGAAPLETYSFLGLPNAADILAALPEGYEDASDEPLPETPSVPPSVTARQIRLWLVSNGVTLAAVNQAIDAIPDANQRELVRVEWEYAPYVERSHPMLIPLAQALGLTEAQVDAAFIAAEKL